MSEQATSQQQPRLPGLWTLLRDIGSFLGGWALIFMEVQHTEVRESVLVFAGSVIATPGVAVGLSSIAEAYRRHSGTGSLPSVPQDSASSQSSP